MLLPPWQRRASDDLHRGARGEAGWEGAWGKPRSTQARCAPPRRLLLAGILSLGMRLMRGPAAPTRRLTTVCGPRACSAEHASSASLSLPMASPVSCSASNCVWGGRRMVCHSSCARAPGCMLARLPTWLGVMMDASGAMRSRKAAGISGRTYSRPSSPITGSHTAGRNAGGGVGGAADGLGHGEGSLAGHAGAAHATTAWNGSGAAAATARVLPQRAHRTRGLDCTAAASRPPAQRCAAGTASQCSLWVAGSQARGVAGSLMGEEGNGNTRCTAQLGPEKRTCAAAVLCHHPARQLPQLAATPPVSRWV